MIKLFDNGAYLLNGTELVEDNVDANAILTQKLGATARIQRKKLQRILWHMVSWRSTTHLTIWTILRSNSIR